MSTTETANSGNGTAGATVPVFENCVGTSTRKLARWVASVFDAELRPFGLKNTQVTVLVMIEYNGPITAARLAEAMHADQSTISRNVSRLVDMGLVDDSRCNQDARACNLMLTDLGRSLLTEVHPAWVRGQARVREVLGGELALAILEAAEQVPAT